MLKNKIYYKLKCMSLFTMLKIYKGDIEITMKDQWSIKTKKGELLKDRISKILIYNN